MADELVSTSRKRTKGGHFCGAIGCNNSRYNKASYKSKPFFTFPKDEARCRKWIQNLRRDDLQGMSAAEIRMKDVRLCNEHFEKNQFNVPSEKKRLVWDAVPTIFKVPNPPPRLTPKRKGKPKSLNKRSGVLVKKPRINTSDEPQRGPLHSKSEVRLGMYMRMDSETSSPEAAIKAEPGFEIESNQDCVLKRLPLENYSPEGSCNNNGNEPFPVALYVNISNVQKENETNIADPRVPSSPTSFPRDSVIKEPTGNHLASSGDFSSWKVSEQSVTEDGEYPKPVFSYPFLIAMALKNSKDGTRTASELYDFLCEHFPYFRNAGQSWKSTLRHYLTRKNRLFVKTDKLKVKKGTESRGNYWSVNPEKLDSIESLCVKWEHPPDAVLACMEYPERFRELLQGCEQQPALFNPATSIANTTDEIDEKLLHIKTEQPHPLGTDILANSILQRTLMKKVKSKTDLSSLKRPHSHSSNRVKYKANDFFSSSSKKRSLHAIDDTYSPK